MASMIRFDHVALLVSDLEAAVHNYREIHGCWTLSRRYRWSLMPAWLTVI